MVERLDVGDGEDRCALGKDRAGEGGGFRSVALSVVADLRSVHAEEAHLEVASVLHQEEGVTVVHVVDGRLDGAVRDAAGNRGRILSPSLIKASCALMAWGSSSELRRSTS